VEAFVLVDGMRVHYRRAGSGRPLLLLHGLVGSSLNWRQNMDSLAQDSEVYALDLFNMGASDRVHGLDASLEATADRIVGIMDALGLDEADIAAHSHGGAVALMLTARHPDRVRRLILFAPANPFCNLGRQLIGFYRTTPGRYIAKLIPLVPNPLKAIALRRMYGDPSRVAQDSLEGYVAGLKIPGTMDHVMQIVRRWADDMSQLHGALTSMVAKPTLLVWGDRDRAVGVASAHELQQLLPQSHLMVLPGVGHIAFEELPEVCNRAMRDWLGSPFQSEQPVSRRDGVESYSHRRRPSEHSVPPMAHGAA
jgi:4,5:9,10-diseco-3-hydroxy-5,9,17-trioxoandrosta-1(10),2-diene-4-oate hydrolase